MNKLFLIGVFLLSASLPSYAQLIGINIGIPKNNQDSAFFSGGSIPSGALQDDSGHYLNDDASHYLIGS